MRRFGGAGERRDQQLVPLTHELLLLVLQAEEYQYSVDNDGDLHGFWDGGNHFYFLRLGPEEEIFQIRGRWRRSLPTELAADAHQLCAEWNRDTIFPKCYATVDDRGRVSLHGEVSADFEHGVTARQLRQVLHCGLATCMQFFDEAERRFPENVTSTVPRTDD